MIVGGGTKGLEQINLSILAADGSRDASAAILAHVDLFQPLTCG